MARWDASFGEGFGLVLVFRAHARARVLARALVSTRARARATKLLWMRKVSDHRSLQRPGCRLTVFLCLNSLRHHGHGHDIMYRPSDLSFAVDGRPSMAQRTRQRPKAIDLSEFGRVAANTEYQMEALDGDNARRHTTGWMVPDDRGQAHLSCVKATGFHLISLRTRLAWNGIGWVDGSLNLLGVCTSPLTTVHMPFLMHSHDS